MADTKDDAKKPAEDTPVVELPPVGHKSWDEFKAWIRDEMQHAANGLHREEREEQNP